MCFFDFSCNFIELRWFVLLGLEGFEDKDYMRVFFLLFEFLCIVWFRRRVRRNEGVSDLGRI